MLGLLHVCDLSRKQAVGTNGRRAASNLATGVSCLAIPMSTRTSVENNFEVGRGYDFYFSPDQDVKVGDKITYNDSSFAVRAVQPYMVPIVGHKHVMAEEKVS